jgi:hypothetical protein
LAPWRAKLNTAVASAACFAIAGIAGAVASAFLIAALYTWLAGQLGPIYACLIIAAVFIVLAIIPILVLGSIKKREERRVAEAAARARATQWVSPATLSLGLQAARMLGKNRNLAVAAIGSLIVGWLAARMMSSAETDEEAAEPAE